MTWQMQKMREWHVQVMDFMIAHPRATYEEIATVFDSHPITIGIIVRSDLFQARLKERQYSRSAAIDEGVKEKLERLAKTGLDSLQRKVEQQRDQMAVDALRETTETALNALGYGSPAAATGAQTNTVIFIGKGDLAEARRRMVDSRAPGDLLGRQNIVTQSEGETVDAEFKSAS